MCLDTIMYTQLCNFEVYLDKERCIYVSSYYCILCIFVLILLCTCIYIIYIHRHIEYVSRRATRYINIKENGKKNLYTTVYYYMCLDTTYLLNFATLRCI